MMASHVFVAGGCSEIHKISFFIFLLAIMKYQLLPLIIFSTLLFLSCCTSTTKSDQKSDLKPNIIFLLTDDQAYYSTGSSGNKQVRTPHMDQLADEGVVFENNYVATAICMASRATIMTGMFEYKTGCNFMHGPLTREKFELSYPILLKNAGYRIGFEGKFGFAVTGEPEEDCPDTSYGCLPVDDFDWWGGGLGMTTYKTADNKYMAQYAEKYPHSTRAYGAGARDFIRESVRLNKPFCLSVSFKAPHLPFTPDPVFDSVYAQVNFNPPLNYGRKAARHLATQSKLGRQYLRMSEMWDTVHYQESLAKYYQLVYGVDYAIGMILEELENQGIADNTIIIFTSDNGYHCGAHSFGGKVLPYEEGAKTPLIIYDPRNKKHHFRTNALTGSVDLAPTILELAGLEIPQNMDGHSLVPLLHDPESKVRDVMPVIQAWGSAPTLSLSVVTKDWRYIYWFFAENIQPAEELFDKVNDPYEMHNLVTVNKVKLNEMRKLYDAVVETWKKDAVPYGYYQQFGMLYDRNIEWEEKKALLPESFLKNYYGELKYVDMQQDPYNYDEILKRAK